MHQYLLNARRVANATDTAMPTRMASTGGNFVSPSSLVAAESPIKMHEFAGGRHTDSRQAEQDSAGDEQRHAEHVGLSETLALHEVEEEREPDALEGEERGEDALVDAAQVRHLEAKHEKQRARLEDQPFAKDHDKSRFRDGQLKDRRRWLLWQAPLDDQLRR